MEPSSKLICFTNLPCAPACQLMAKSPMWRLLECAFLNWSDISAIIFLLRPKRLFLFMLGTGTKCMFCSIYFFIYIAETKNYYKLMMGFFYAIFEMLDPLNCTNVWLDYLLLTPGFLLELCIQMTMTMNQVLDLSK
jgi:hypothetical protein